MTWFKTKPKPRTPDTPHTPHHQHPRRHQPNIEDAMQERLANFLIEHGRLTKPRSGRAPLHFLGACNNFDGTKDFSIRTHVRYEDGSRKTFDSHVRWYESDHLRLIR
jgi:hypothetical protein